MAHRWAWITVEWARPDYFAAGQSRGRVPRTRRSNEVSPVPFTFHPSLARRPSPITAPISASSEPTSNAADVPAFRERTATKEASPCVGSLLRLPLHQWTPTSGTGAGGGGFWGIPSPRTELRSASRTATNRSGGGGPPSLWKLASEAGVELVQCRVEQCCCAAVPPRQTTHRASRFRHRETLRSGSCGA